MLPVRGFVWEPQTQLPTGGQRDLACSPRAISRYQVRSLTAPSDPPLGARIAGPYRIPKLTVRVRFPSPAPHAKNVAIHTNWAPFSFWNGARRHQKSALVPLPVSYT